MDFVSKIVSGNIDRIKRNISNSFVQDLDVEKGFDDELEKGKWNVGDQKFFRGNMHYVAELKPDGSPRWKRVKKTSGGSNGSSAASSTSSTSTTSISSKTDSSKPTSSAPNKDNSSDSVDEMKKKLSEYKEDLQKKTEYLDKLVDASHDNPNDNKKIADMCRKISDMKGSIKELEGKIASVGNAITDDKSSSNKNDNKSTAANNTSVKNNSTSNKKDKFVDKVTSVVDEFGSYYPFSDFSKEKVEKIISDNISESKEFLSFKFPSGGSVSQALYHNTDQKTYNLQGSDLTFETDKSYNTTSRYAGHLGTITTHYYIYYKGKRMSFSSSSTGSKWGSSPSEAKKECLYSGLIRYLSEKYNYDVSR
jgi:predicted RNA-binding protein with EMAP domain